MTCHSYMNLKRENGNPQKLTQLSSRSHARHLMGKRTAQKDTITDITSDRQVNSNFSYRWPPASLTFNNYFYLILYLYTSRIATNNNAPHLKSPKNQNRRAALGGFHFCGFYFSIVATFLQSSCPLCFSFVFCFCCL